MKKWTRLGLLCLCAGWPSRLMAATFCSAGYITEKVRHEETIDAYGANLQAINVFSYEFTSDGDVVPKSAWVPAEAALLQNGTRRLVMVEIVNDNRGGPGVFRDASAGQLIDALLSDSLRRGKLVRQLVAITAQTQGIEIDFEGLLAHTRPYYTTFVQELRAALPASKRLAVVVQPKTDNTIGNGGHVIDWRAIEPYLDWIRIMAYYYSWDSSPPGADVDNQQLKRLALYSLNDPAQGIPRAKARILLSLWGWDWPVQPKGRGLLIQYNDAMQIAASQGITPARDPRTHDLVFQYRASDGGLHEVWIDDATSLEERTTLLTDLNYPHVDFWNLGTGPTEFWTWVRDHMSPVCPDLRPTPVAASKLVISGLSPASARAGGPALTLSLTGTGFSSSTVVLWDGAPRFPVAASATTLQVSLSSADLQTAGARWVTASDGQGVSNALPFYIVGTPMLQTISPAVVTASGNAFTLVAKGAGYEPESQIQCDGHSRTTVFVSSGELQCQISAGDIAAPGHIQITTFNPTSGAASSALTLLVQPASAVSVSGNSNAVVTPNPWNSALSGGMPVRFTHLVPGTTVKIFTLSARYVCRLDATDGTAAWYLKNDAGERVASGYYLYILTDPQGGQTRGKLAVVR